MRFPRFALIVACIAAPAALMMTSTTPTARAAAITDNVQTGAAGKYSVLGASTVTNTGATILARSLGLSPGTSVTGFPPGVVTPPAVIDVANTRAQDAQNSLTSAYFDAAGRALTGTVPADLGGQVLGSGVYAAGGKGALSLNGTLVLDAGGNTDAVFIFQTNSTLTTGSSSVVSLINGAQGCRVHWVVGSSATLGTGSAFVGTILAQASITVTTGVSVRGRALARTGAVTLDSNSFTPGSCAPPTGSPAVTTPGAGPTVPAVPVVPAAPATTTTTIPPTTTTTIVAFPDFPITGSGLGLLTLATILVAGGVGAAIISRRRRTHPSTS
ncbi:MAG: ice-binding family protein [Ilumatobacteraceae bacterium]